MLALDSTADHPAALLASMLAALAAGDARRARELADALDRRTDGPTWPSDGPSRFRARMETGRVYEATAAALLAGRGIALPCC